MSETQEIVHVITYTGKELAQHNIFKLVDAVFKNFNNPKYNDKLNHNPKEIARLLTSSRTIILFAILNGKIIAYLIAEIITQNEQKMMHIYYLYTARIHRGKGLASYLLNIIENRTNDLKINTLSLTFDTHNKSLKHFYLNQYFEFDPRFRSNQRYDMLFKSID